MKAADDGQKMNHGKVFKSFSVILWRYSFQRQTEQGGIEFIQPSLNTQSNQAKFNLN